MRVRAFTLAPSTPPTPRCFPHSFRCVTVVLMFNCLNLLIGEVPVLGQPFPLFRGQVLVRHSVQKTPLPLAGRPLRPRLFPLPVPYLPPQFRFAAVHVRAVVLLQPQDKQNYFSPFENRIFYKLQCVKPRTETIEYVQFWKLSEADMNAELLLIETQSTHSSYTVLLYAHTCMKQRKRNSSQKYTNDEIWYALDSDRENQKKMKVFETSHPKEQSRTVN